MTENQKLREALQAGLHYAQEALDLHDVANQRHPSTEPERNAILDDMRLISEALAMPTAGKMINGLTQSETDASASVSGLTAASVGEREAFGYFYIVNGVHEGFCKGVEPPPDDSYDEGTLVPVYRSALSAGDAVDAQRYRWLREQHWSNSAICCVYKPKQNVRLGGTCPSGYLLDSVIDASMRKGQL